MGDLNAKVGCEKISNTVGPYGLRDVNDRGEKLIEWAQINQLVQTTSEKEMDMQKNLGQEKETK